jgi:peptidoglycan hydrolase CwlO-like protein
VRSLGSITSDLELSTIYSAADFFILPSLEDNLPNTILEAMSCGTPVIGFDVGGIPDLVKDRVTGRLVPYKDISQLAAAILECVFNPAQVQQMGQTCRQVIEENYSLTTQAERYLSLYKDLLGIPETDRVPFLSDSQTQESISQSEILVSLDVSCGSAFTEVLDQILLKALPLKLYDTQIALSDTQSQLQLTQAQLHETQTQSQDILKQLHDAVDQLRNTHDQFQITQTQLHTTQVQLYATQSQLQTTQSHLQDTKIQLKDTQKELAQSQTEHQKVQGQLARSQTKLQRTQERLTQTQTWLQEAQQEIESMKSSKFWKLRTRWIKLRDRLPLLRKS